jgi:hypothetical protein
MMTTVNRSSTWTRRRSSRRVRLHGRERRVERRVAARSRSRSEGEEEERTPRPPVVDHGPRRPRQDLAPRRDPRGQRDGGEAGASPSTSARTPSK